MPVKGSVHHSPLGKKEKEREGDLEGGEKAGFRCPSREGWVRVKKGSVRGKVRGAPTRSKRSRPQGWGKKN